MNDIKRNRAIHNISDTMLEQLREPPSSRSAYVLPDTMEDSEYSDYKDLVNNTYFAIVSNPFLAELAMEVSMLNEIDKPDSEKDIASDYGNVLTYMAHLMASSHFGYSEFMEVNHLARRKKGS